MIKLLYGPCLEMMKEIPDGSVDFILTDPPYGTTACKWDQVIPFDPMWEQIKRIRKPRAAVCLFGSEPFSSYLRLSNIKEFKYDWVWCKSQSGNPFLVNKQPLKIHEIISIFYNHNYYPVMSEGKMRVKGGGKNNKIFGNTEKIINDKYYPESILYSNNCTDKKCRLHPTQKPVKLLEYLIKTYTQEGETVLDFTMGSGSTGIACLNTGRNFIGIEWSPVKPHDHWFNIAKNRIYEHEKKMAIDKKESLF